MAMRRPVLVVAGVIVKDGKVLVAQRKADCRREPLKWEFPGGKVEYGEAPQESLRREIMEELGVGIEVGEPFCASSAVSGGMHVVLLFFKATLASGEPRPIDVNDWRWLDAGSLGDLDWAAADLPAVRKLMEGR